MPVISITIIGGIWIAVSLHLVVFLLRLVVNHKLRVECSIIAFSLIFDDWVL